MQQAVIILTAAFILSVALPCHADGEAKDRIWIPGYYDSNGEWIPGRFWPPQNVKNGRFWVPGHYRDGQWVPGRFWPGPECDEEANETGDVVK